MGNADLDGPCSSENGSRDGVLNFDHGNQGRAGRRQYFPYIRGFVTCCSRELASTWGGDRGSLRNELR